MPDAFRKAQLEDESGLAKVHVDSWRLAYRGLISDKFLDNLSYERREMTWTQALSDPANRSFAYLATDKAGQATGFVWAGPERNGATPYLGEVYAIYLLREAQRKGIGRKLMQLAADGLLERGFPSMLLWVLKENNPSRRFYESLSGEYLCGKNVEIGGQNLIEVAYGWKDLHKLADSGE
jgi:ribosomal protein S18 acetylase RimI-like enzyme